MTRLESRLFCAILLSFGIGLAMQAYLPTVQSQEPGKKTLPVLPPTALSPADNPTTSEKVALGKQLFFDSRLSGDDSRSCASCHISEKAFADGLPRAKGDGGKELHRNTPALLNAGFYSAYFWDGRAGSLEEQALFPIQAPDEMNQDLPALEKELNAIPAYVAQFQAVFGSRITAANIAKALAAFERTLVSRNSPFDRYLAGDKDALSEEAHRGWELFRSDAGCIRCHSGPNFSDSKFYRLGTSFTDKGRGAITGDKRAFYAFRTPGLRDVARTAPYLHDGSMETLSQVVEYYYRGAPIQSPDGLPLDIAPLLGQSYSEISAIVAFLESLNGEIPQVSPPRLP
ncbi:MAG: cytochrome-c peroxidase [Acidobacteria bacterium]|nr:cytochrome-c peroxidase [Acidobacteriota bacterium]